MLPVVVKLPSPPKLAMLSRGAGGPPPADIFTSHTPTNVFFSAGCATSVSGIVTHKKASPISPFFLVIVTRCKGAAFRIIAVRFSTRFLIIPQIERMHLVKNGEIIRSTDTLGVGLAIRFSGSNQNRGDRAEIVTQLSGRRLAGRFQTPTMWRWKLMRFARV